MKHHPRIQPRQFGAAIVLHHIITPDHIGHANPFERRDMHVRELSSLQPSITLRSV
jgi:hypothetical protein